MSQKTRGSETCFSSSPQPLQFLHFLQEKALRRLHFFHLCFPRCDHRPKQSQALERLSVSPLGNIVNRSWNFSISSRAGLRDCTRNSQRLVLLSSLLHHVAHRTEIVVHALRFDLQVHRSMALPQARSASETRPMDPWNALATIPSCKWKTTIPSCKWKTPVLKCRASAVPRIDPFRAKHSYSSSSSSKHNRKCYITSFNFTVRLQNPRLASQARLQVSPNWATWPSCWSPCVANPQCML